MSVKLEIILFAMFIQIALDFLYVSVSVSVTLHQYIKMLEGHPRSSNDDNDDYRAHLVVYFVCAIDCIPELLYPVTLNF